MNHLNWLNIQKCYPYPLIFKSVKKKRIFIKKKKKKGEKTIIRATGLKSESIMPINILHIRLDFWYGIIHTFFKIIFLQSIFTTFLTLTALYKSMGKIFKFKILYSWLQNWNLH